MSINDRGSKKWTSLMLPEHVDMLKEVFAENNYVEKPILDDQQIQENEIMLQKALREDIPVTIVHYTKYKIHEIRKKIRSVDSFSGILHVEDYEIKLSNVIEVNLH